MKSILYQSIAHRLIEAQAVKSILSINGLPIDENKSTTVFPALYFKFADIEYVPIGENSEDVNYRIQLHIVFESTTDDAIRNINDIPKRLNKEESTLIQITKLLNHWKPKGADSQLFLEKEYQDNNYDTLSVWVQEYAVTYSSCK